MCNIIRLITIHGNIFLTLASKNFLLVRWWNASTHCYSPNDCHRGNLYEYCSRIDNSEQSLAVVAGVRASSSLALTKQETFLLIF